MKYLGIIEEIHAVNVYKLGEQDQQHAYEYLMAALRISHKLIRKISQLEPTVIYREGCQRALSFSNLEIDRRNIPETFVRFLTTYINDESGYYQALHPGTRIVYLDEHFTPYHQFVDEGILKEDVQVGREEEWTRVVALDLKDDDNGISLVGGAHTCSNQDDCGHWLDLLRAEGINPMAYTLFDRTEDHIAVARSDMTINAKSKLAFIDLLEARGYPDLGSLVRRAWLR